MKRSISRKAGGISSSLDVAIVVGSEDMQSFSGTGAAGKTHQETDQVVDSVLASLRRYAEKSTFTGQNGFGERSKRHVQFGL